MSQAATEVVPEEELGIPKPRRLMHTVTEEEDGTTCLYLYYGIKEICFDEPRLMPFGRGLLDNPRFRAEEACRWADGEPYEWAEVQELLEILLEEEILVRATELPEDGEEGEVRRHVSQPDPSGPEQRSTWSRHEDRCPYLTAEIFGHSQGSEHLELLIPSYRIAHPAFDRDDRQVGEANVYPPELRVPVPTEWRTCPYEGSRYQDERPMNLSALRSMSEHWIETLGHTLDARNHFLRATGLPADEELRLGDLYLLSLFVLVIPGYLMQRPRKPLANGELSVALASMFRVTDGVRFSIEHMIHGHGIHGHGAGDLDLDAHLDPQAFLAYVERECLFLGESGVCAGPTPRVLELLELMIAGRAPARVRESEGGLDAEVGSLDTAFAYTVLTTWLTTAVELFWHRTADLARSLDEAVRSLEAPADCPRPDVPETLRAWVRSHRRFQTEPPRLRRAEVLEALLRRCARLAEADPGGRFGKEGVSQPWSELAEASRLAPAADSEGDREGKAAAALHRFLQRRHLPSALPAGTLEALVPAVLRGAALERRALAVVNALQRRINELLERPPMGRPVDRRDLIAQGRVLAGAVGEEDTPETAARRLATEVAERLLGIEIELREDELRVRHGDSRVVLDTT